MIFCECWSIYIYIYTYIHIYIHKERDRHSDFCSRCSPSRRPSPDAGHPPLRWRRRNRTQTYTRADRSSLLLDGPAEVILFIHPYWIYIYVYLLDLDIFTYIKRNRVPTYTRAELLDGPTEVILYIYIHVYMYIYIYIYIYILYIYICIYIYTHYI